ncbi:MAG: DoxX family protein [Bacteroidetes bacterium]|nr:DoxX family protein [Bacteroidota bacterium]
MSTGNSRVTKVIYWVTTTIIAAMFFITGVGNLVPFDHIAHDMTHLGYPWYFMNILGTWKIAASLTLLFPFPQRVKNWAYAGAFFDLTGAALSRFFVHDPLISIIIPLMILIPVATSYLNGIKISRAKIALNS